ncbi:MAG TPA: hypothetical protein VH643_15895 [Gemmataceae bacterium]
MTEAEWLAGADPKPMLDEMLFDREEATDEATSPRKLRLFMVACVRRQWHHLHDQRLRRALNIAEQFAELGAPREAPGEILEAKAQAKAAWNSIEDGPPLSAGIAAEFAVAPVRETLRNSLLPNASCAAHHACSAALPAPPYSPSETPKMREVRYLRPEAKAQADLLRCIFCNPFRPITLDPAWLTWHGGLLVSMAQKMYHSRDFADMPVLADALEEAGCQDQDILAHCRSGGEHVRGCWVVDALLGKS